jgi:outer membrane protein assembly factor BamB
MRKVFLDANNVCVAIKPGGTGDITKTHIVWKQAKGLPYVPSPVFYKGHLYMVKNGGLVQVLDAKTGEIVSFERAYGRASYYASPVIGDGKIYLVDQKGDLSVLSAEPKWKQLSRAKLGEEVFSTPAIADGRIYIRTAGHLYCFGNSP